MIESFIASLDLVAAEALLIAKREGIVAAASQTLLDNWKVNKAELVGCKLSSVGTGALSLRAINGSGGIASGQRYGLTFVPPLGVAIEKVCTGQSVNFDGREYLLLLQSQAARDGCANHCQLLDEHQQRLQLALRSTGLAIWEINLVTQETYTSQEMYSLCGYPFGSPELDLGNFDNLVHPEDRMNLLSRKVMDDGIDDNLLQSRYRFKTPSGKYIWLESIATVLRNPGTGAPERLIGFSRNIDTQMMVLEQLRSSERNLKRSQTAAQLGSFSLRIASGVSRLTAELASLIGLSDAMIHPTLQTLISMIEPGDRNRFSEGIELAKLGRQVKGMEITVRLPSGEPAFFEVSIEPDFDQFGRVDAVFGICQSVTERRALERRFHQAQKMEAVGQLTGGIAHDFNNLLMVVMGNLQLIERQSSIDVDALRRIKAAMAAAQRGSDLTRRMLAFSRQQDLQYTDVDVAAMLEGMKDMLQQALSSAASLEIIDNPDAWSARADQTMLETAILNLCINARDAIRQSSLNEGSGKLTITFANLEIKDGEWPDCEDLVAGDYLAISVSDNGCGIPPENLDKVFQPFFTTKGPEAGSGLGLSMIYGFVRQTGGHVKINSALGKGTTVTLFIPAKIPQPRQDGNKDGSTMTEDTRKDFLSQIDDVLATTLKPHEPARRCTVLVVEDNDSVREVAAAMIAELDFDVLTACNGPEGYKIIEQHDNIDLLLTDVIMAGGMSGPELAAKAVTLRPALKVLFMSGYAPGSVRMIRNLPDSIELVNKPFTRDDLAARVKRALAA